MNNYSFLDKLLHRLILSPKFMREMLFDIEKKTFSNDNFDYRNDHVFIAGLARSGSTILLNTIYKSRIFSTFTYSDMPFIMSPNLWRKINSRSRRSDFIDRFHKDGIKISTNSPEAFEEVFWMTYDDDNLAIKKNNFESLIQLVSLKYNKKRYLSKNNQNLKRLHLINNIYPKSKILIPFREPLQHSFSLLNQHTRFCSLQEEDSFVLKYMQLIGHFEFGLSYKPLKNKIQYSDHLNINHWLEQWYLVYSDIYEIKKSIKNIHTVCYENLCNDPRTWNNIKSLININESQESNFNLSSKKIELDYNKNLYDKCTRIYECLKD